MSIAASTAYAHTQSLHMQYDCVKLDCMMMLLLLLLLLLLLMLLAAGLRFDVVIIVADSIPDIR